MKKKLKIASAAVAFGTIASAVSALHMYKNFFTRKHAPAASLLV